MTLKKIAGAEIYMLRLIFRTKPKYSTAYIGMYALSQSAPLLSAYLWKHIIEDLVVVQSSKDVGYISLRLFAVYLCVTLLAPVFERLRSVIREHIASTASSELDIKMMSKMSTINMSYYDDPANRDAIAAAEQHKSYVNTYGFWLLETAVQIVAFAGACVMFLALNPLFGVLFLCTHIPGAILNYKSDRNMDQVSIVQIPEQRKTGYYLSILSSDYYAKDLRLFNLASYFKEKFVNSRNILRTMRNRQFEKDAIKTGLSSLFSVSGLIVVILISVYRTAQGNMEFGYLSMYIALSTTVGETFSIILSAFIIQLDVVVPHINKYLEFTHSENQLDERMPIIAQGFDIEFKSVTFKYPGSAQYALRDVSFKIASGEKLAIVGENGAGKSTIIKLLLRFYEPENGEICIGGKDIRDYSIDEYRTLFSACFQSVNRYSLSIRENIALSDIERAGDTSAISRAMDFVGLYEVFANSEPNLETELTRIFSEDGLELSGGQWQKIALARTFFCDSNIVIFDEPSSALDPEAEEFFLESVRRRSEGKTTILISHRLSNLIYADKIILMVDGEVSEFGTHSELLSHSGKYAKMYKLQAAAYTTGVE